MIIACGDGVWLGFFFSIDIFIMSMVHDLVLYVLVSSHVSSFFTFIFILMYFFSCRYCQDMRS